MFAAFGFDWIFVAPLVFFLILLILSSKPDDCLRSERKLAAESKQFVGKNLMSDPPIRLRKPRKQRSGCFGRILITVIGGVIAAGLVALGSSWKATFDGCAKTESDLRAEYAGLSWEIYAREAKVATEVGQSKTIADLRTLLKEPYYASAKYKDESLLELRTQFIINQDRLRIVEGNEILGKDLKRLDENIKQLPRYAELQDIMDGTISYALQDDDLKDLSVIIWATVSRDRFSLFFNPLRVSYEETCTIKNVTYNWLDLNKLVYHGTLRAFTDAEKQRIEWLKTHPESD